MACCPPPEVRARIGYYGEEHLARLQLITELQAEGFNLKGIARLLEDAHGVTDRLFAVRRAVSEPFETEQPEVFTFAELQERFGAQDAEVIEKAVKLGALVPLGSDRYEAPSPSLLDAAEEVVSRGASLHTALAVLGQMERTLEGGREVVRAPLPRRGLEAVRRGRLPGGPLVRGAGVDRAAAADSLAGAAGHLPADDVARGAGCLRQGARAVLEAMTDAPKTPPQHDPLDAPQEPQPGQDGSAWSALGARGLAAALKPLAAIAGMADDIKAMTGDVNRMADSTSTLPEVTQTLTTIRGHVERLDREVAEMHAAVEEIRATLEPLGAQLESVTRITNRLPGGRKYRRAQAADDDVATAHDAE